MTEAKKSKIKQPLPHVDMSQFEVSTNELIIGGYTLSQIEHLVGRTPFYAYDKSLISNTVKALKTALPKGIELHYAIKANPYPSLVHLMSQLVDGFDVASKKEMLLALQSGMSSTNISFAGPGKTIQDINAAIIAGITLHAESISEVERILAQGKSLAIKPHVALRVNPKFEMKSSGMTMGGGAKPFGIDEEQLPDLISNLPYEHIHFRGFHIYAGSQNLNTAAIIDMHHNIFKLVKQLVSLVPVDIDYINIGGGLGIPYFPGEERLTITPITNNLSNLMSEYRSELQNITLIMELGRYLVAEAGVYVSKIIDCKNSRGTNYLVCDGGLHHHLANSGNFGQVIRKNYPVAIGNKIEIDEGKPLFETENVSIVGPLCTPLDIIANNINLPKAIVGDYIVVYQSGAYGATASPQDFLSQPSLGEILL